MNKTHLRPIALKSLAAINNQLMFFLFAERELMRKLEDFSSATSMLYTTDVFVNNVYAKRINVRLENVKDVQYKNRSFTFGSYFSTSYEIVADYCEEAIGLLKKLSNKAVVKSDSNQLDVKYYEILQNSSFNTVDLLLIKTLRYFRLRRNHFIHHSNVIRQDFLELITNSGLDLNTYWGKTRGNLDFSSLNTDIFNEEQTVVLVKILRIILEVLDTNLSGNLDSNKVLNHLFLTQVYPKSKPNNQTIDAVARKLKTLAFLQYNLQCNLDDAKAIVQPYI